MAGAVFEGIGVSAGGSIGGYAMDRLGGTMSFRYFALAAFALCAIHVGIQLVFARVYPDIKRPATEALQANATEDILSADQAEQRNETNEKHKYTNSC